MGGIGGTNNMELAAAIVVIYVILINFFILKYLKEIRDELRKINTPQE